jgi:nucleotide-binding universal stress UspA family protein
VRLGRNRPYEAAGRPRVLVPFLGELDPVVLDAAIRIARAEEAVLVPAYLLLLPMELGPESPSTREVQAAMPLLEAVEQAALREGVPVDARIERGRTPTHTLRRLWDVEHFDRIVVPAGGRSGFTAKDLAWILTNAPSETMILKPDPVVQPT